MILVSRVIYHHGHNITHSKISPWHDNSYHWNIGKHRSLVDYTHSCTEALHWRHNDRGGVSHHQPHDCLLSRLFGRRSKKTSKLRGTGLCAGNSPGPVNSPRKGPVTRKMFPFDDVIMIVVSFAVKLNQICKKTSQVSGVLTGFNWTKYVEKGPVTSL